MKLITYYITLGVISINRSSLLYNLTFFTFILGAGHQKKRNKTYFVLGVIFLRFVHNHEKASANMCDKKFLLGTKMFTSFADRKKQWALRFCRRTEELLNEVLQIFSYNVYSISNEFLYLCLIYLL